MIVFDASTLILLAKAELLENFLQNVGQKVVIPKGVQRECCTGKKSMDELMIEKAIKEKRIHVRPTRNRKIYERISSDFALGRGEGEAIALAVSTKAQVVAIDDKSGINACKLLGIPFTTAVGVLIRMNEKGLTETGEALMKLEMLAKYGRYKKRIVEDARSKLEGSK